jgi:hypothetical protein
MRKIFSLLLFSFSLISYSQYVPDTVIFGRFGTYNVHRGYEVHKGYLHLYKKTFKRDTVKCILLICDTSRTFTTHSYIKYDTTISEYSKFTKEQREDYIGIGTIDTIWQTPLDEVCWIKGFEIRELHNTSEGEVDPGICPNCWNDYWKHISYLNNNKKPFSRNIIIWQKQ